MKFGGDNHHDAPVCSFCGKREAQVSKMFSKVLGEGDLFICDECIKLCNEMLEEEMRARAVQHADIAAGTSSAARRYCRAAQTQGNKGYSG